MMVGESSIWQMLKERAQRPYFRQLHVTGPRSVTARCLFIRYPILAVTTGGKKISTTTSAFGMDSMFNCECWSHAGSSGNKSTHVAGTLPEEARFVTVPARIRKNLN